MSVQDFLTSFEQITLRESKRQNLKYRPHAIKCLGLITAARPDLELFDPMCDVISAVFQEIVDAEHDDDMDVDNGDGAGDRDS